MPSSAPPSRKVNTDDFFSSSRRRHTRLQGDWSSDVCSSDLEAQLAKDQAALAQGQADLQRYAQLDERKSIAPQTYADQQFLVQQQQAAIKADQAAIAQARLNISLCHITAPVAGRVGLRLVDPGNYVTASSQPGIAVITSIKPKIGRHTSELQ